MSIKEIMDNLNLCLENTKTTALHYQIYYHVSHGTVYPHYYLNDGQHRCDLKGCPAKRIANVSTIPQN